MIVPKESIFKIAATNISGEERVKSLPKELLAYIFSFLGKNDIQAFVSLNIGLNKYIVAVVNFYETNLIKDFILNRVERLKEEIFFNQRCSLISISHNIDTKGCVSLQQLKQCVLGIKEPLLRTIKTLDEDKLIELSELSDVQPPYFIRDIFKLAPFEKRIDALDALDPLNEEECLSISYGLLQVDHVERAISVAMLISEDKRGRSLMLASDNLVKSGNIERAMSIATSISNEYYKRLAFEKIVNALAKAKDIERAINFAMLISEDKREDALADIFIHCMWAGDIEQAINVALLIPYEDRDSFLKSPAVFKNLLKLADIDHVTEITMLISEEAFRNTTFEYLVNELTSAGDSLRAISPALSISDEIRKDAALECIAKDLWQTGNNKCATKAALLISDRIHRGAVLKDISKGLMLAGNIDRAISVLILIPSEVDRDSALECVVKDLIGMDEYQCAITAALAISHKGMQGSALKNISYYLIQAGNLDKAISAAMLISDEFIKETVLSEIKR